MESLVIENVRSALEKGTLVTIVAEQKGKEEDIGARGKAAPKL